MPTGGVDFLVAAGVDEALAGTIVGAVGTGLTDAGIGAGLGGIVGGIENGAGGILKGAEGGAISGLGGGLGGALGGIGGGVIGGAAGGALGGEVTHGNVGLDAALGGVGGGVSAYLGGDSLTAPASSTSAPGLGTSTPSGSGIGAGATPPTSAAASGGAGVGAGGASAPASVPFSSPDATSVGNDVAVQAPGGNTFAPVNGAPTVSPFNTPPTNINTGPDGLPSGGGLNNTLQSLGNNSGVPTGNSAAPLNTGNGGALPWTANSIQAESGAELAAGNGDPYTTGAIDNSVNNLNAPAGGGSGGGSNMAGAKPPSSGANLFNTITGGGTFGQDLSAAGNVLSSNANLLIPAAGLGYQAIKGNQTLKGENNIKDIAAQEQAQGASLENYLQTGTLPAGLQAAVTQAGNAAKASITSQYAARGMTGSSAEAQDLAAVDQSVQVNGANMALNLMNQGISETGMASSLYTQIMNDSLAKDNALASAMTNFGIMASGGTPGVNLASLLGKGTSAPGL